MITNDPSDPRLTHGPETELGEEADARSSGDADRAEAFVRPLRLSYRHAASCGAVTTMRTEIAETYARHPKFYSGTYCTGCRMHRPVAEFLWTADGEVVGS